MSFIKIMGYDVIRLDKVIAKNHIDELVSLANLIPQVNYDGEMILREEKGSSILHGKWDHSFAVCHRNEIIAFLIAYEREAESNDQYPNNSLYINEIAVKVDFQKKGIGKKLLKFFIDYSKKQGFKFLTGEFNFRVQTNSAATNKHVQKMYESLGFKKVSSKEYPNRVDTIYQLKTP